MKRYRDENGQLTMTLAQLKKETAAEAAAYYHTGGIYFNFADFNEYVMIEPEPLHTSKALTEKTCLSRPIAWAPSCRMWHPMAWNWWQLNKSIKKQGQNRPCFFNAAVFPLSLYAHPKPCKASPSPPPPSESRQFWKVSPSAPPVPMPGAPHASPR